MINFLLDKYDAKLVQSPVKPLLYLMKSFPCPRIIESFFSEYKNRELLFTAFNEYFLKNQKMKSRFKTLYPLFNKEVEHACKLNKTSKICLFKPKFKKLSTLF